MTRRTSHSDNSYEIYTWNHRGKMVSATAFNSANVQQWQEVYYYDAVGRLATTVTVDGVGGNPSERHAIFDGTDLAELLMELNGDDKVTKTVLSGPSVDMVMAEESISYAANGTPTFELSWPMGDHQGTADAILKAGTVTNQPLRTAFGEKIANTGTESDSAFGFQGQLDQSKTEFGNFRARQMQTNAGRFISQDPIRFASGQTNFYQFVGNRPTDGVDPSGLGGYFFDGTGNWPNPKEYTNVYRLYLAYDTAKNGKKYYAYGLGTGYDASGKPYLWGTRWFWSRHEGATGDTIENRVEWMIKNLEKELPNDKIVDLFGFSRGSATAVRFLHRIQQEVDNGNPLYRGVKVRFVALFDSVPTEEGIGTSAWRSMTDYERHYIDNASDTKWQLPVNMKFEIQPLHLVAVDESRKEFAVTDLVRALQVGFRGVHSDVGGGYGGNFFEFITREFVSEYSRKFKLSLFDQNVIASFDGNWRLLYENHFHLKLQSKSLGYEVTDNSDKLYNDNEQRRLPANLKLHTSVLWFSQNPKNDVSRYTFLPKGTFNYYKRVVDLAK